MYTNTISFELPDTVVGIALSRYYGALTISFASEEAATYWADAIFQRIPGQPEKVLIKESWTTNEIFPVLGREAGRLAAAVMTPPARPRVSDD